MHQVKYSMTINVPGKKPNECNRNNRVRLYCITPGFLFTYVQETFDTNPGVQLFCLHLAREAVGPDQGMKTDSSFHRGMTK